MASNLSSVQMPADANAQPIQVLAPGTIVNDDIDVTTDNSAVPSGAEIVEIAVTNDAYILFGASGDSVSSSTGMFFPKGAAVYRIPDGATHLHYIRDAADGRITVTALV